MVESVRVTAILCHELSEIILFEFALMAVPVVFPRKYPGAPPAVKNRLKVALALFPELNR